MRPFKINNQANWSLPKSSKSRKKQPSGFFSIFLENMVQLLEYLMQHFFSPALKKSSDSILVMLSEYSKDPGSSYPNVSKKKSEKNFL